METADRTLFFAPKIIAPSRPTTSSSYVLAAHPRGCGRSNSTRRRSVASQQLPKNPNIPLTGPVPSGMDPTCAAAIGGLPTQVAACVGEATPVPTTGDVAHDQQGYVLSRITLVRTPLIIVVGDRR